MTAPRRPWLTLGVLALAIVARPHARAWAAAEVKLDRDYLAGLVEKLPPCPFQKDGQYRGKVHAYRLVAIDPKTRRFLVTCQVEGEFRPPIDTGDWKKFRFDVKAGVRIEPAADGTPRFRVEVEEVKRRELEGVGGVLARFLGKFFDEIVTQVASGKATSMSDKLNATILRKVNTFKEYGVFNGIDYAPDRVVLRFDLTRLRSEGIAGFVFAEPAPGTTPLFRWFNPRRGDHLYTLDPGAVDRRTYRAEGIACHVYPGPRPGTIPLYRWRSRRESFYTAAPDGERVARAGYRLEGIACYIVPAPTPGMVPLYRFVDPRTALHFYSLHPHADFAK